MPWRLEILTQGIPKGDSGAVGAGHPGGKASGFEATCFWIQVLAQLLTHALDFSGLLCKTGKEYKLTFGVNIAH